MEGIPLRVVMERLGHSTSAVTTNIYAHVLPHMQDKVLPIVDGIFNSCVQNVCKRPENPDF